MTPDERERLAGIIAEELRRALSADARHVDPSRGRTWLEPPVRPAPPPRSDAPPPWAGAAQSLGDVAPIRMPRPSAHRDAPGPAAAAVRAAAAGAPSAPVAAARALRSTAVSASDARRANPAPAGRRSIIGVELPLGVSRRHVHLSEGDAATLFGSSALDVDRTIRQPGQFAARQRVSILGPRGQIDGVRVVGPPRGETQVELSRADLARLGVAAPLAASGSLHQSAGGVALLGTSGRIVLARGVIVAARHLHLAPDDARRWGVRDGVLLDIRCGVGARSVTWHDVLVRSGPAHATEFHIDEDEANAAAVENGAMVRVVARREPRSAHRPLVTEQQLLRLVRDGAPIPAGAILTPSARDRARALGIDVS